MINIQATADDHSIRFFQLIGMHIDSVQTVKFKDIHKQSIMDAISPAYTTIFSICAVAYLVSWLIVKWMVPKMKKIEL